MKKAIEISRKIASIICGIILFTACDDCLDELPSKSTRLPVSTIEQLDAILAKYTDFCEEPNKAALCGHDDYGFPVALYDAQPMFFPGPTQILQSYLWDYENLANGSDVFWGGDGYNKSGEYSKIFRANMVLSCLNDVEGSSEDKARLKAEAHFIRAYSHWNLVNTYSLPYTDATKTEPGIPLKKSTSFEESAGRGTLEDTYKFIESDLQEALKCKTTLIQDGKCKHWRANTAGINGFMARYYLNRNDYTNALKHANDALTEYSTLVNYNSEMGEEDSMGVGINFPTTFEWDANIYTKRIKWKETLYMKFLYSTNVSTLFFPSEDLQDLYDTEHDLRYKYHFTEGVMDMYLCDYPYPIYTFFSMNHIPSGPTTAEMYLIKAESQARLGDYTQAMETVNTLRAKRMVPGEWVKLQANNQTEAIRQILEERRREMPFSQRWFDLRRLNNNEDPNDDIADVTRTFYRISSTTIYDKEEPIIYTLKKNSRKYAFPIRENEIELSNGAMQQNTY